MVQHLVFGLLYLQEGNLIELPLVTSARVQIIHNSADKAARVVDVWINDSLAFRQFCI
jgi:hypothetical protein